MDIAAFRKWVLDPARNVEELYFAELVLEHAESQLPRRKNETWNDRFEADRKKNRRRSIDPGYRPQITRKRLDRAEPHLVSLTRLSCSFFYEDRRATDLSALRFLPEIEVFHTHTQLRDLSGLLPIAASLKDLSVTDDRLRDLSALGSLPKLDHVSLTLGHPWPEPAGLEALIACVRINLRLNLQVLEGIPSWPQAKHVTLSAAGSPLRDFQKLPEMPVVEELKAPAAALDGIGRYPTLKKLELEGVFEDLSPLAGLPLLRDLTLGGERVEDLSPLARLPSLSRLTLHRERGIVLDPLLESPTLRIVKAPRCKVIATELASLNAAISWQREDFALDAPRTLPPLRAIRYQPDHPDMKALRESSRPASGRELAARGDHTFIESEGAWMLALMEKTLGSQLGRGWGGVRLFPSDFRRGSLCIAFFRDIERRSAWSMLEMVRSVLGLARFPWKAMIAFDETEEDDWIDEDRGDEDDVYIKEPDEIEEDRQRARDHRAFLEREHQLRLGAQGLPVKPSETEAEPADSVPEPEEGDSPAPVTYDPPDALRLTLTTDIAWISDGWAEDASVILDREIEDWHALPEPPEQRPRPVR